MTGAAHLSHHAQIQAPPVPTLVLDDLADKINYHHDAVEKHLTTAVEHAIYAGRLLDRGRWVAGYWAGDVAGER